MIDDSEVLTPEKVDAAKGILPNCIAARSSKTVVWPNGMKWIPIYCANCGKDGGQVLESDYDRVKNFAFYLCEPCAEKWSPMANTLVEPDLVFWRKVQQAQLEHYGRELTQEELITALKDESSIISKLAKER